MESSVKIIDPGLWEAGGHHAALLGKLISSADRKYPVDVFAHRQMDGKLQELAEQSQIQAFRHFSTNFYEHYDANGKRTIANLQVYIRKLASEYISVFDFLSSSGTTEDVVCFYPCLNWEHANALELALSMSKESLKYRHKVCLMFRPNVPGTIEDLFHKMSFFRLGNRSSVKLFATDWETKEYFTNLGVGLDGIHPCYLIPCVNDSKLNSSNSIPHFLLYMGDAKENKGFTKLPGLAKRLMSHFGESVRLTIQFTQAWATPDVLSTISELRQLSEDNPQLELHDSFWSSAKVGSIFKEIDSVICTYDPKAYNLKSSGLVWLATYYDVHVVIANTCWLTREMDRLEHSYTVDPSLIGVTTNERSSDTKSDYYNSLFKDLMTWLGE